MTQLTEFAKGFVQGCREQGLSFDQMHKSAEAAIEQIPELKEDLDCIQGLDKQAYSVVNFLKTLVPGAAKAGKGLPLGGGPAGRSFFPKLPKPASGGLTTAIKSHPVGGALWEGGKGAIAGGGADYITGEATEAMLGPEGRFDPKLRYILGAAGLGSRAKLPGYTKVQQYGPGSASAIPMVKQRTLGQFVDPLQRRLLSKPMGAAAGATLFTDLANQATRGESQRAGDMLRSVRELDPAIADAVSQGHLGVPAADVLGEAPAAPGVTTGPSLEGAPKPPAGKPSQEFSIGRWWEGLSPGQKTGILLGGLGILGGPILSGAGRSGLGMGSTAIGGLLLADMLGVFGKPGQYTSMLGDFLGFGGGEAPQVQPPTKQPPAAIPGTEMMIPDAPGDQPPASPVATGPVADMFQDNQIDASEAVQIMGDPQLTAQAINSPQAEAMLRSAIQNHPETAKSMQTLASKLDSWLTPESSILSVMTTPRGKKVSGHEGMGLDPASAQKLIQVVKQIYGV